MNTKTKEVKSEFKFCVGYGCKQSMSLTEGDLCDECLSRMAEEYEAQREMEDPLNGFND